MFVTASDRVPLKGLANLTFVIQRNGPDTDRYKNKIKIIIFYFLTLKNILK